MTPNEFAAWIRGVNVALAGAMPSKELWAEVVKEAQGVAPNLNPLKGCFDRPQPDVHQPPIKPGIFDSVRKGPYPPNPREFILADTFPHGLEQR